MEVMQRCSRIRKEEVDEEDDVMILSNRNGKRMIVIQMLLDKGGERMMVPMKMMVMNETLVSEKVGGKCLVRMMVIERGSSKLGG